MDTDVKKEFLDDQQDILDEFDENNIVQEDFIPDQRNAVQFEITEIDSDLKTKKTPYICIICGSKWKTQSWLIRHINAHSDEKNFQCPDCPKTFKYQSSLKNHSKYHKETSPPSPLQCQVCNKMLSTFQIMRRHMRKQHGEIFTTRSSLDIHMKRYHDPDDRKPLVCEECGKTYETQSRYNYERHVAAHKNKKDQNPECNICLRKFARKYLKAHMTTHSTEKPFACDMCYKTFRLKEYLTVHKKTHLSPSQALINCIYCSKVFNKKSGLVTHMKVHHRGLPNAKGAIPSCTVCKIVCKSMEDLKEHVGTHSVENRFECEICGMKAKFKYLIQKHIENVHFKIRNEKNMKDAECPICSKKCSLRNLKPHMACHSTEKPFACDVCDKTYKTKDNLKDHKLRHIQAKETKKRCSYCKESFRGRYPLMDHMRIHHRGLPANPEGPPFKCTVCRSTFRMIGDLKDHVTIHRREFLCAICDRNFASKSILRSHMKRTHQKLKKQEKVEDAEEVIGE